VIVNTATYGGAGGGAAFFSTHPDSSEIGLHELGHTFFALTDEYGDITDTYTGAEPVAPNATIDTNRATTKWHELIAAATPLPTMSNPDCTKEDTRASPVAAGTVGLFEGANRAHCGAYRAERDCRMRTLGQGFCAVCRNAIVARLKGFLPAASGPTLGVQFTGTLPANATQRWFTYNWPACWHVIWNVVPVSSIPGAPEIGWRVQIERASRDRITYWIHVSNMTAHPVDIEARYAIVAGE
jgi:hypothetical protein